MPAPLRVMQVVLSLVIGGTEKLVYDIVRHVDPKIISPGVCCLDILGRFGEELEQEGFPTYVLQRQPGIDWGLAKKLASIIEQERVDVIHAHQYTPYFYALMAAFYCKFRKFAPPPKIVFTEHGIPYPYQKKFKRVLLNPFLCHWADEIVTIAEYTKSLLIEYENFPARRMKVVYNGIDLKRFSQTIDRARKKEALGIPLDSNVIGIVARLDPVKNHPMLFRAFQHIIPQFPRTHLLIIGGGPEEENLKKLAESLGITENTHFLGSRDDVSELLHVFDIFTLPSFSEGMSVTLIEAMGAGVPIVATDVGGNPEVIQDQKSGYLVQSDDEHAMSAALMTLLQNEKLRLTIGRAGQERAHELFSLDKMVNTYLDLYFKVLGRSLREYKQE